ncbi:peptidase M61 domain protein [Fusarium tjaetaba]|uniref:Peptidase M61 domain protein n=1 Tax=Fusarium tjaetaba TaxID=1567544 RepID=A0A8H5S2H0_9HYPO|nr:peptidase M61 domain protein [Fusarium tjaetaba]KAF5643379.1 peptidase M61 domain protein [Fusarium tjaetaba]
MARSKNPSIYLRLAPHFDKEGVSALSVHLEIENPSVQDGQPMFLFDTFMDNVPGHPYCESDIHAADDDGPLPLAFRDIPRLNRDTQQQWCPTRQTKGHVTLRFDAFPRTVSEKTPLGARVDLRRDQGGLQGVGRWFLPLLISDRVHKNTVEWVLPHETPPSTRCVWSLGEGPEPVVVIGRADTMWRTVYMTGPVCSYPDSAAQKGDILAACYWFGDLLPNLDRLKAYNTSLYPKMAEHFRVPGESYRVFIRKTKVGFGGTGFIGSYGLEYDESVADETDDSLLLLFTHEMVHSFSDLSPEDDGYDNDWFREGIAELYSACLPYRFGFRGKAFLIESLNRHLQGYFSSPRISMDIREAGQEMFSDWYAEWIPYKRGCIYLLFIDCCMRKQDGQCDLLYNGRLDQMVVDLSHRWRVGETVRASDWLNQIRNELENSGFSLDDYFRNMLNGKQLVDFSGLSFDKPSICFIPVEIPILEFGFDKRSRSTRVITGVVPASNAETAGLRDGMHLLEASRPSNCVENVNEIYQVKVQDGNIGQTIQFLPRRPERALAWKVQDSVSEP